MQKEIYAIKVQQWLKEWDDEVHFDPQKKRAKPAPYFYLFSISAGTLKRLSGVYRRSAKERRTAAEDLGIQRKHDPRRSEKIKEYVKNGFPWSELSSAKRKSGRYNDLKNPGWLPTAIVVNILGPDDERRGKKVAPEDLVTVEEIDERLCKIRLPSSFSESWKYSTIPPIEVIDGQHRLWAFENPDFETEGYDLPVVASYGLDISWQAYLFYTINISPKRINRSLAYDLYPLLRTEEWLQRFEGPSIYRETRAQDLVDILYSHPKSPWYRWINMLGETGGPKMVSQSAWIRSLIASYIRSYEGRGIKIGGLFGAPVGKDKLVLPWGKEEQAALLIYIGQNLKDAIRQPHLIWAKSLRKEVQLSLIPDEDKDPAFYGKNTLLNQDQGIRALLYVTNDFLYLQSDSLELEGVFSEQQTGSVEEIVEGDIEEIEKHGKLSGFLKRLLQVLAEFDWRSFSASDLSRELQQKKAGYRGSGGYKVLRMDLLDFISEKGNSELKSLAIQVKKVVG